MAADILSAINIALSDALSNDSLAYQHLRDVRLAQQQKLFFAKSAESLKSLK
jgi:hypothetical protein